METNFNKELQVCLRSGHDNPGESTVSVLVNEEVDGR
jgi:hypothetical protein